MLDADKQCIAIIINLNMIKHFFLFLNLYMAGISRLNSNNAYLYLKIKNRVQLTYYKKVFHILTIKMLLNKSSYYLLFMSA